MHHRPLICASILASALAAWTTLRPPELEADEATPARPYTPDIAPASDEARRALPRIRVPSGLRVELYAAEPLLANPVAFSFDERGRMFVVETFRLHAGVTDIRDHMNWLDDDLASRTVADREALYRKYLGDKLSTYTLEQDRIRLLEDTDGDGKADRSTVFADGFHRLADGLGAGVLARQGNVWFTCIPNLWLLRDTTGAGKADSRTALHTGFGIHVGYIGHDLHGLRFGPDGKLYFSIGDRGLNVQTAGRAVSSPDCGAVLRCNPDGSDLEVVATGLRNPQELAFDDHGNLFTRDNNADGGDKARWVYVVEGGDSGWRIGYQFLKSPEQLGPWNAEKLWQPAWNGQAAYLVPPLANLANGPSGLTYNPGCTLLPERYQGHFFLCDFRGGSGNSGIRAFANKPRGAAFELTGEHEFAWSVLATDTDFGPDGALYLSDWVEGWAKPNKGRIYKVFDPARKNDPRVGEVKKLLAEGMTQRSLRELTKLLEHPDQRVRQEAQFALAERHGVAYRSLVRVARLGKNPLARLHALWGLGQIGRIAPEALAPVLDLTTDPDAEVRAQAAKVLGDGHMRAALDKLLPLLRDPVSRVRFFAAIALGKLGRQEAFTPLVAMLRENADKDPYLRHAGVMGLVGVNDLTLLRQVSADQSAAIRMAALLTLRRLHSLEVARFLNDAESRLVLEAARAINDELIDMAMPQLAALLPRSGLAEPLLYRILNANFRLGQAENANAVAVFAARSDVPEALRLEALGLLGEWAKPSGRDRIVGLWRPLPARPAQFARDALRAALDGILRGPDKVRQEAARVAGQLGIKEIGPVLFAQFADTKRPVRVRIEMLQALARLQDERLPQALPLALAANDPLLRSAGRLVLAQLRPAEAIPELAAALDRGALSERQGALAVLGGIKAPEADGVLARWLDRLLAGEVPPELRLDLLDAAVRRRTPGLQAQLARYDAARPKGDPLAPYREALSGGNAEVGRKIFLSKSEVSCLRCHKVNGSGGEIGPDLSKIGAQQKREYLLEALVDPNRQIAKGFETVMLALKNGQVRVGIVKAEDATEVRLITSEGQLLTVPKGQIEERTRGKSPMPEDLMKHLSKAELRDLVEFLAGLK